MLRAYQIIDGKGEGKVPETERKNGMEIIGREKMKEVTETNEKDTTHFRVWCLFMNCGEGQALCWAKPPAASPFSSGCRGQALCFAKPPAASPFSSGCRGQALCFAKPPAASPFSSGCRDLSLQKPTSSEKAVCAYQLPTLHFV